MVESELVKLFDRKISTLELQDIEDITVHTFGLLGNYFSFGRLDVQTAGTVTEFFAEKIANPEYVQNQIFDAKLKDEHERKDIEKTEIEQISHRVYGEEEKSKLAPEADSHIPQDQKVTVEQKIPPTSLEEGDSTGFDWAHVSEKQAEDIRDLQAQLEVVENKYKTGVKEALRTE